MNDQDENSMRFPSPEHLEGERIEDMGVEIYKERRRDL